MDVFQTIIVPATEVEAARAKAAETPGGEGMFTTPLSPNGLPPATHYISSGYIPPVEMAMPYGTDSSAEDPHVAMARLGLQMIHEPATVPEAKPVPVKKKGFF